MTDNEELAYLAGFIDGEGTISIAAHSNNDGPYALWNCRWATILEQLANRRVHTTCRKGHSYVDGSYWVTKKGFRLCKQCSLANQRAQRRKAKVNV